MSDSLRPRKEAVCSPGTSEIKKDLPMHSLANTEEVLETDFGRGRGGGTMKERYEGESFPHVHGPDSFAIITRHEAHRKACR
jgi:hypothetical protein